MSDSSNSNPQQSSNPNPKHSPLNSDLSKFKPWVFRPKKVVYSLDDMAPTKKEFSTSHWNQEENEKYMDFLMKFREVIEGEKKRRRKWHLNRIMSKHIGTRSHEQCRSHHQKMIKNYRTIQGILNHLQGNTRAVASKISYDPPSTSVASPEEPAQSVNMAGEESIFNILDNALDGESSYLRIPFFCREESDDLF